MRASFSLVEQSSDCLQGTSPLLIILFCIGGLASALPCPCHSSDTKTPLSVSDVLAIPLYFYIQVSFLLAFQEKNNIFSRASVDHPGGIKSHDQILHLQTSSLPTNLHRPPSLKEAFRGNVRNLWCFMPPGEKRSLWRSRGIKALQ